MRRYAHTQRFAIAMPPLKKRPAAAARGRAAPRRRAPRAPGPAALEAPAAAAAAAAPPRPKPRRRGAEPEQRRPGRDKRLGKKKSGPSGYKCAQRARDAARQAAEAAAARAAVAERALEEEVLRGERLAVQLGDAEARAVAAASAAASWQAAARKARLAAPAAQGELASATENWERWMAICDVPRPRRRDATGARGGRPRRPPGRPLGAGPRPCCRRARARRRGRPRGPRHRARRRLNAGGLERGPQGIPKLLPRTSPSEAPAQVSLRQLKSSSAHYHAHARTRAGALTHGALAARTSAAHARKPHIR